MGDQKCTVVRAPKTWGGCKTVANKGCLTGVFAEEMNDLCRGLGDCGGSVNIDGMFSKNYRVKGSPDLSSGEISDLEFLARPVSGQYAEVEDYSEYLEAAGIFGEPGGVGSGGDGEVLNTKQIGKGIVGIGYAAGIALNILEGNPLSLSLGGVSSAPLAPLAGAMIGAGVGMIAGALLAKELGLSPGGSLLMSMGGGMVGAALGASIVDGMVATCISSGLCAVFFWVGIILIIVSFFFSGSDCDDYVVEFECKTWQPPSGGDDCGKCNGDLLKPCSEYRCGSLGAACVLINKGSDDELCVDENPNDVRPPVLGPQLGVISENEVYMDISDSGFGIGSVDGGCVDAYTPLIFGVTTDEAAQCRFDIVENGFEDMEFDLGGNAYLYNHTTTFTLPDPSHGQSQGGNWTGDLTFYIKCRDGHGHENPGFYEVGLCVNEGPDRTAAIIRMVEPADNGVVSFDVSSVNVSIITNELADCRWDVVDTDYSIMTNSMSCGDSLGNPSSVMGYRCEGIVPVVGGDNSYYVRCMDQPWLGESGERNANSQSFVYRLRRPESRIAIDWIEPSESFEIDSEMTTIELTVRTSGGGDWHRCSYSFSGYENMIELFETGADKLHKQPLNRPAGSHAIYVECEDESGDSVQGLTEFDIIHDTSTPLVARVWQEGGSLYVITTEDAECRYSVDSCMFGWDSGEVAGIGETHVIGVVRGEGYYIKCEDEFGNAPSGCSISVRAL
jgi:hypothetical protein